MASKFSEIFLNNFHEHSDFKYKDLDIKILLLETSGDSSRLYLKIQGIKFRTGITLEDNWITKVIKNKENPNKMSMMDVLLKSIFDNKKIKSGLIDALTRKRIQLWKDLPQGYDDDQH
jgi:hypothetical protein